MTRKTWSTINETRNNKATSWFTLIDHSGIKIEFARSVDQSSGLPIFTFHYSAPASSFGFGWHTSIIDALNFPRLKPYVRELREKLEVLGLWE